MNYLKLENESSNELNFYEQQISKLAYANTVIMAQLSSLFEEKKIIIKLIEDAQKREQEQESFQAEKEKRLRRCAKDVERKYRCLEHGCEKSYGSEGSLLQHIRLKHPKINLLNPPLMLDPA